MQLELFLLSEMRNRTEVDAALAQRGATGDDVERAREVVLAAHSGSPPIHPISYFLTDLVPDAEEAVEPSSYGDRRRFLRLPSWPAVRFTYLVRPDGISTSPEFVALDPADPPSMSSAQDLRPWAVTRSDIERWLGPPAAIDGWEFQADLTYELSARAGSPPSRHRLDVDLGLLQLVHAL